jgi:5-methylthioribose kinase
MFILNANEPEELAAYLQQLKWLDEQETIVSLSKPRRKYELCAACGDGYRSFIVKQSRGYVEKYPVLAPASLYLPKVLFYQNSVADTVQQIMPKL